MMGKVPGIISFAILVSFDALLETGSWLTRKAATCQSAATTRVGGGGEGTSVLPYPMSAHHTPYQGYHVQRLHGGGSSGSLAVSSERNRHSGHKKDKKDKRHSHSHKHKHKHKYMYAGGAGGAWEKAQRQGISARTLHLRPEGSRGVGLLLAEDATVTGYSDGEGAAIRAGIPLGAKVVGVNGVPVLSKDNVVAHLKTATAATIGNGGAGGSGENDGDGGVLFTFMPPTGGAAVAGGGRRRRLQQWAATASQRQKAPHADVGGVSERQWERWQQQ